MFKKELMNERGNTVFDDDYVEKRYNIVISGLLSAYEIIWLYSEFIVIQLINLHAFL